MSLLIRKVARAKWETVPHLSVDAIAAYAVTSDLRTTGNTLSFWEVSGLETLEEAIVAIASAYQRIEKLDVIWLEKSAVAAQELRLSKSPGRTAATHMMQAHADLIDLDLDALGAVARLVSVACRNGRSKRYSKKAIADLLVAASRAGTLNQAEMHPELLRELSL